MAMEAKDIEERGKQIAKAASEGDPPATLLSLLESLKGWTASEKLLRQTKIGIHVNKLRQNKDPNVARTATSLINKWKSDVKKPGGGASPAPGKSSTNGTSSPAAGGTPKQDVKADTKAKGKYSGDPEKRNAAVDKVNYNLTDSQTRDACIKLMYDGLAFQSEECTFSMYDVREPQILIFSQPPLISSQLPAQSN